MYVLLHIPKPAHSQALHIHQQKFQEMIPMNKIKPYAKATMKLLSTFAIPIALLLLLYKTVFDIPVNWRFAVYFLPLFSIASSRHYVPSVIETGIEASEDFTAGFKKKLESSLWEIVGENEETMVLRPKFDMLYTRIWREHVSVDMSGGRVLLFGANSYIKRLKALIDGKRTLWERIGVRIAAYIVLIIMLLVPVLIEYGLVNDLKIRIDEYKTRNVAMLDLEETGLPGNTEGNINSYGGAVESEDYFFYIKENLKLCRSDKNFNNEKLLIDKPGGTGMGYLNSAGEWVFFTSGKTMNRIKIDGSGQETIYSMGYLLDVHLLDNWIYFISHSDRFRLYKMDTSGKNLHAISDKGIRDFSIYDGRIYFSHEKDGHGMLESMDMDGKDVRFVANILPFDLVKKGDTLYYTDSHDFNLYKYRLVEAGEPEKLVDRVVSKFIVSGNRIYYSLKSEDVGYPGTGLYMMGLDGGLAEKITDETSIENLSILGNWILFHSSENQGWGTPKRMPADGRSIIEMN